METHILTMENLQNAIAQWLVDEGETDITDGTMLIENTGDVFTVTITSDENSH